MHRTNHLNSNDSVQLSEDEVRQIKMPTTDTSTNSNANTNDKPIVNETNKDIMTVTAVSNEKTTKVDQNNDGTLSDSILTGNPEGNKKRRASMSSKALVILGLSKKTNSSSSLGFYKYTINNDR